MDAYRDALIRTVVKFVFLIRLVFEAASNSARRIVFSEGEDERVLRAAQAVLEETSEVPIVIGRPEMIQQRCERLGLESAPIGILTLSIRNEMTGIAIGAVMVHRGEADSLISDAVGEFR